MRTFVLAASLALAGITQVQAQTTCSDALLGLSDVLTIGERDVFVGTIRKTATPLPACALPALPSFSAPSTSQKVVAWGATASLDTSFHGNVLVHSGSTLLVKPGSYRIGALTQEWGSVLRVDTTGQGKSGARPGVQIVVMGGVQWMDGFTTVYPGLSDSLSATRIAVYLPEGSPVVVGNGTSLRMQLVAPSSSVTFGDQTKLWGRVLARSVVWRNDVKARYAANAFPPTWNPRTTVSILGPRRFWTRATSAPVSWTINGAAQTSQTTESFSAEGARWIRRFSGVVGDSVLAMVDWTAPLVRIVSPTSNSVTNKTKMAVSYTVDGTAKRDTATLVEGVNTITRTATDSAGNVGSDSVIVTLDTQAPVVAIVSPANNLVTNKTKVPVSYTVDGIVKLDTAMLAEGANTITRTATDAAGNIGSASAIVTLDTRAPVVSIVSPANNSATNKSKVAVGYTVDGIAKLDTANLVEGPNTITRTSTDAAGNIGLDSVVVNLDTQAPVVAIVSPANNSWANSSPVALIYTVDGVQTTEQRNLTEGTNVLVVDAVDPAGNHGVGSTAVKLDTRAPVIEFLSVVDGDTVLVSSLDVTWSADGVSRTDASVLSVGWNTLERHDTDSAGNTGSKSIQVFRASSVPRDSLVAVASAPAQAFPYTPIVVSGDRSTIPQGIVPTFDLRQIGGLPVRISKDGSAFQILTREADDLVLELSLADSNGALVTSLDTVTIQVREPTTLWERLTALNRAARVSEGDHSISITNPSSAWSFATERDSLAISGLVQLDTTNRRIDWISTGYSGSFDDSTEQWKHSKLPLLPGDNLVRYFYHDDSGALSVAQALVTRNAVGRVSSFVVDPMVIFAREMQSHQIRVRGTFGAGVSVLELEQVTPGGSRVLASLNDAGSGVDSVAGDGVWSGSFAYQADSGETVFLRIRSGYFESEVHAFNSLPRISEAQLQSYVELNDSAGNLMARVDSVLGVEAARDSVISWLAKQPEVAAVGVAPDGFSVAWVSPNGVNAVISVAPDSTMGFPDQIPMKAQGVDLRPGINPNPFDAWNIRLDSWVSQEPTRWIHTPSPAFADYEVDLNPWADWAQHKAAFLSAHGGVWGIAIAKSSSVSMVMNAWDKKLAGSFVYSGNHNKQFRDLLLGLGAFQGSSAASIPQLVLVGNPKKRTQIGLTSEFFKQNYTPDLNGTLLFSGSCQGARERDKFGTKLKHSYAVEMQDTRLGGDNNAFVGFTSWTSGEAVRVTGDRLLHYLYLGVTLEAAMDSLYHDPILNATKNVRKNSAQHVLEWTGTHVGYGAYVSQLRWYGNGKFSLSPQVLAAGNNLYGQLGNGSTRFSDDLVPAKTTGNVIAVATSHGASAGVLRNGKVLSWGSNNNDELGSNEAATSGQRTTPDSVLYMSAGVVKPLPKVVSLKGANFGHGADNLTIEGRFIALDSDGKVWAWGKNNLGQTGLPSTIRANRAKNIALGKKAVTIEAGGRHGIALLEDGTVGTFGYGYTLGQGEASNGSQYLPIEQGVGVVMQQKQNGSCPEMGDPNNILEGAVGVGAGANVSFAITADDKVYAWGNNYQGEAGTTEWVAGMYCAREVSGLAGKGLQTIVGGTSHTLALTADGVVWAWGSNQYGAIGLGGVGGTLLPTSISIPGTVRKIAAGDDVSAALDYDGNAYVWGRNDQGQLGLGDRQTTGLPTMLPGKYRDIAVGTAHVLAIPVDEPADY